MYEIELRSGFLRDDIHEFLMKIRHDILVNESFKSAKYELLNPFRKVSDKRHKQNKCWMHELTNHSIKVNSSGGHKVNSKSSPFPVSNLGKNNQTNPFGHFQKSKLSNNSRLITMCQTTKKEWRSWNSNSDT